MAEESKGFYHPSKKWRHRLRGKEIVVTKQKKRKKRTQKTRGELSFWPGGGEGEGTLCGEPATHRGKGLEKKNRGLKGSDSKSGGRKKEHVGG